MIPKRFTNLVFSLFMSFIMSGMMSCIVTFINVGAVENFLFIWLKAWSMAFIIAFPILLLLTPMVKRLVSLVVEH
jgi:hypothetical protein